MNIVDDPVQGAVCDHKEFARNVGTCGQQLFKRTGGNHAIPKKVYAYNSVKSTLATMFRRPQFVNKINSWRSRSVNAGVMYDIFDGQMWNELVDSDGERFVDDYRSLLLTLNVDWFEPFANGRIHSVGAIYPSINNLPRAERYKPESLILVGIMPGPKERSKHQINRYLRPLVDELLDL